MAINRFRLRLSVELLGSVLNSRQAETGLITTGMSQCLCRLVYIVCLKSPCMTKSRKKKGGQWLPAVKFTAHSRQDAAIMSVSEAGETKFDGPFSHCISRFDHTNVTNARSVLGVWDVHHAHSVLNATEDTEELTFIVASSEAETMTLKTGWKMTLVTGLLWPLRAYLSGGRGIHSLGSRFCPTGPPKVISSFASFSFDSNSIT